MDAGQTSGTTLVERSTNRMRIGILGAGISGLSCAWLLKQSGVEATVFEAQDYVGGLARSFRWHDFSCDFASHRLFTMDEHVLHQLLALVPMGRHIRRSRIYLGGKWLRDPINIGEIFCRFNPVITGAMAWDYLWRPRGGCPDSFNAFVRQRYGRAINNFLFRPYTERLFGLPGDEISVEWARQKVRLSGPLDFLRESSKKKFSYFYYPVRGGYGALAQALYRSVQGQVRLNCQVRSIETQEDRIRAVNFRQEGQDGRAEFDQVISTLPLTVLGRMLGQQFTLGFRAVQSVYLLADQPCVSDNHWVYFMDRQNVVNRMVEFKNMSPVDCPPDRSVLCAEVTLECRDLVDQVIHDVVRSGLLKREAILDALVVREPFGYPTYTREYQSEVERATQFLKQFKNLYLVGRSAEFAHKEVDENFASAQEVVGEISRLRSPVILRKEQEKSMAKSPAEPLVYVVILTYNHVEDTLECLKSLKGQTYPRSVTVVVDNGSSDDTPAVVRREFPDVQVIETGQNLGVPWGYNIGFSVALEAGAQYVLMLNNDTTVSPEMLRQLVDAAEADDSIGITMPQVLYYDSPNEIWASGARRRKFPPAIVTVGGGNQAQSPLEPSRSIEFAISCGILIHRRAFERAGLFDPGYFFFFDDWDFSERVRAHGLKILYVPAARMWHKVSRTTRQQGRQALFYRVWGESATRFYRRHGRPVILSLPVHIGYIVAREIVSGNVRMLRHFWTGVRAGLTKPLGTLPSASDVPSYLAGIRPLRQADALDPGEIPLPK